MTELCTSESFIVRVYRIDPHDPQRLTGLIEALDGSGTQTPFTDIEGMVTVLRRRIGKKRGRRRIAGLPAEAVIEQKE